MASELYQEAQTSHSTCWPLLRVLSLQNGHWTGHQQLVSPAESFHPFCVTGLRVCWQFGLKYLSWFSENTRHNKLRRWLSSRRDTHQVISYNYLKFSSIKPLFIVYFCNLITVHCTFVIYYRYTIKVIFFKG